MSSSRRKPEGSKLAAIAKAGPMAKLAAAVHDLWRQDLIARGWKRGRFDPKTRRHDALAPFENLDPDDQWTLVEILESIGVERELVSSVAYRRGEGGEAVPLRTRDMRKGLRIESSGADQRTGETAQGRVIGWTTDPRSRRLEMVQVLWDDRTTSEHAALEAEIRVARRIGITRPLGG